MRLIIKIDRIAGGGKFHGRKKKKAEQERREKEKEKKRQGIFTDKCIKESISDKVTFE